MTGFGFPKPRRPAAGSICPAALAVLAASAGVCPGPSLAGQNTPPVVRFDFESGDLQGWQVVEGGFGKIVTDRATFHNRPKVKYNKQGKYYLSTVEMPDDRPNDRMTGIVESPVFVLAGPKMSFRISGGKHRDTYVALCTLDGVEHVQARGRFDETMLPVTWNTPRLVGQPVFLRIVDRNRGGWGHVDFDDFTAVGRIDEAATRRRRLLRLRQQFVAAGGPTRAAVEDLRRTFGKRYPRGREFLARLDALERRAAADDAPAPAKLLSELAALRREALSANPLVREHPIVFVVRRQYRSHYHAIDTLFHTGEYNPDRQIEHKKLFDGGGALKVLDLSGPAKGVRTLVDVPKGIARDPDVHFSGKRIIFALRRHVDADYHIHEIDAAGSAVRQLTFAEGVCDFDPIYLPDDDIVFSSTREPKYNMCSRDVAANLFRMEGDGANIHQITKNTLFDNHAELLPDGRILYARWEYVDRNFGDAHGLWTVNPDGTNQAVFWGNNTASPGAAFNAHVIPGTAEIICTLGPHHDRLWGAVAIIDPQRGLDGRSPVVRTWPADAIRLCRDAGPFDCDSFARVRPKYEDPWPLSPKYFLCSRMTGKGEQMGIYVIDVFGNEVLLHAEGPGCYDPIPLAPRPRPPVIPSRRNFRDETGHLYVMDVYEGTHMRGVKRGSVKRLRVVESPEKRHWSPGSWNGQGYTAPGMNWHSLENKRILGSVAVEADGSAYFTVPAEAFVYFQLLDANGMMIQSMRSGTLVQPGERTGCVGCHDNRLAAPPHRPSMALAKPPRRLEPWHGRPRLFGFMAEVQPVLNKHCLKCHDYGGKGAKKLLLAPDRTIGFNAAYTELWRKGYVRCVGAGPAQIQPAYSWGSHASKLVAVLRGGHNNVSLSAEEMDRILTWVDLNAPYYAHYACAYPDSLTGRCPLTRKQLARLRELTGLDVGRARNHAGNPGPQVSFDRPELSACLSKFADKSDPKYVEALAVIRAGRDMLKKRPRADMPGFVPCPTDQRRQVKYARRRRIEATIRQAIRAGNRVYDRRGTQ